MTAQDFNQVYRKAVKLLSYRPRSINEMRFRLKKYTQSSTIIDKTINQLKQDQLLDDQDFAIWWVEQRTTNNLKGNIAISAELKQKDINHHLIDKVLLSDQQELNLAKKILTNKQSKFTDLSFHDKKAKALQYLKSRGVSYQNAYSAIDEFFNNE